MRATWARYEAALAALSDPATMRQLLEEADIEMDGEKPVEIGLQIPVVQPPWRQEWGISAAEN